MSNPLIENWTAASPSSHRYFVSFWWRDTNTDVHGFGNLIADLDAPIRSAEHLSALTTHIRHEASVDPRVMIVITNIVRLDWP